MGDDIAAKLKRTAQNRRGEGVVDHQRHAVRVGDAGQALDIAHQQGGVGHRFAKHKAGAPVKQGVNFLVGGFGGEKARFNAKPLERKGKQVDRAAVNGRGADDVVPRRGDVEHGQQVRRLTGGGEHRAHAAFQRGNFIFHHLYGGVGNARIHVAGHRQVEQLAQMLGGIVFIGRALVDGQNAGLAVFRLIARLDALGFHAHGYTPPVYLYRYACL